MSWVHSFSFLLLLISLLLVGKASAYGNIVTTLPGYPGELNFTLETGYISVGDVEFFYYFVESEDNPAIDPLFLYVNGGPGCTGLNGLLFQVGPLSFNLTGYSGGVPLLKYTDEAWTKSANIIFVDAPVGAGFSYSTTQAGYYSTDTETATQLYEFIRSWLNVHTNYTTNPFFVASDSYAGLYPPMIVTAIADGNKAGLEPMINIAGYSLGCPHTFTNLERNSQIEYAHRMALISDELNDFLVTNCNGSYIDVDSTNGACLEALEIYDQCIAQINKQNILLPNCALLSPKPEKEIHRLLKEDATSYIQSLNSTEFYCQNFEYLMMDIWGKDRSIQEALYVRPGTISEFFRCNMTLAGYTSDIDSVVGYHKNLTSKGYQVLVFSGDHDMVMSHVAIESWIKSLEIDIDYDWRPWFIDGQIQGYNRRFASDGYRLTYVTVKGGGHSPPEGKRHVVREMFRRWIHYYPI